jgi:hypothetical protein
MSAYLICNIKQRLYMLGIDSSDAYSLNRSEWFLFSEEKCRELTRISSRDQ